MMGQTAGANAAISYDYTGNSFDVRSAPALGDKISASVFFSDQITSNHNGVVGESDIVSWSISTGTLTYTSVSATLFRGQPPYVNLPAPALNWNMFRFENGDIVEWNFAVLTSSTEPWNIAATLNTDGFVSDSITVPGPNQTESIGGQPGVWTTSSTVPIPTAIWLFSTGLAGMLGIRIIRKKA